MNIVRTNKVLSLLLAIAMLVGFMPINKAEAATVTTVGALPTGSIIIDEGSMWEHKTGNGYTGSGEKKPLEWLVVAQNHYRSGETTVVSNEIIGKQVFDNTGINGSSHWGNSNNIRPWLNSTFYNSFGTEFKSAVIETNLENVTYQNSSYTTRDKVWLPSQLRWG